MHNKITMRYPTSWSGEMWREAAPCGNGLIGVSVYGGIKREIILINHAYLWRGGKNCEVPDISDKLPIVREYLKKNDPISADGIISNSLHEKGYSPDTTMPLPLGDIVINSESNGVFSHYRREIDMEKAEVIVSWHDNETNADYKRSTFVSRDNNIVYTKITCSKPIINVQIGFTVHDTETLGQTKINNSESYAKDGYIYYAAYNDGIYYTGDYGAVTRVTADENAITSESGSMIDVKNAHEILIASRIFVASDRVKEFSDKSAISSDISYNEELEKHVLLHKKDYCAVNFEISNQDKNSSNEELLLDAYEEEASSELIEKLYAYGRYLFVCSTSDKNTLPCHLVGLWNGTYQCFWAIYMYNVNFEMIYWQALSGSLPEYLRLALDYTESFMEDFRENAKKVFGCRGIYINSVNTPESGLTKCLANHIVNWTTGAAWFSQHFWDYYEYTGDVEYLKNHALPFMYESALFYEDFMITGDDGKLMFSPSVSPENTAGNIAALNRGEIETCVNATMDIATVKELFTNLISACKITGMYSDKIENWKEIISKLPEYRVNEDGAIKEWTHDFYKDNYKHRHHSHLYPVFPGHEIKKDNPLYPAFVKAEDLRLAEGLSDQSSWGMVFIAGIAARMGKGERALYALDTIARTSLMNNFFTLHNDWRRMGPVYCRDFRIAPFQIDANIGIPAVINEMLLFSDGDDIVVLPALPKKWTCGKIEGLSARGGVICDILWNESSVKVSLKSKTPTAKNIIFGGQSVKIDINLAAEVTFEVK